MQCPICLIDDHYLLEYTCGHQLCLHCGLRLVKLYAKKECALCKQESKKFYIRKTSTNKKTNAEIKKMEKVLSKISLQKKKMQCIDEDMIFEDNEAEKTVIELLAQKCKKCEHVCENINDLRLHYKNTHAILLCKECTDNKKLFWYEHEFYSISNLKKHKQGKLNEPGFNGHIYCIHCNLYLYDEALAKKHCNEVHILCSICDILGNKYRYYKGWAELEEHFKKSHYCCTFESCLKIKAYAFPYKTELLEHLHKVHKLQKSIQDLQTKKECDIKYMDPYYLANIKLRVRSEVVNEAPEVKIQKNNQDYLNRFKIIEDKRQQSIRKAYVTRLGISNIETILEIIENIVSQRISVQEGCDQLKLILDGKVILKILKDLNFEKAQKNVKEYYKILENEILFPKFESTHTDTVTKKKAEKPIGFKIINITKKGSK